MASDAYDEAVSHLNAIRGLADSIANHYAKAGKQSKDAAYCILEEVEYLAKEINRLAGRGAVLDGAPAREAVTNADADFLMGLPLHPGCAPDVGLTLDNLARRIRSLASRPQEPTPERKP